MSAKSEKKPVNFRNRFLDRDRHMCFSHTEKKHGGEFSFRERKRQTWLFWIEYEPIADVFCRIRTFDEWITTRFTSKTQETRFELGRQSEIVDRNICFQPGFPTRFPAI